MSASRTEAAPLRPPLVSRLRGQLRNIAPFATLLGLVALFSALSPPDPLLQRSDPCVLIRRVLPGHFRYHRQSFHSGFQPRSGGMACAAAPVKARPV